MAEDLLKRRVTSRSCLAVQGGSNGGMLVGNMLLGSVFVLVFVFFGCFAFFAVCFFFCFSYVFFGCLAFLFSWLVLVCLCLSYLFLAGSKKVTFLLFFGDLFCLFFFLVPGGSNANNGIFVCWLGFSVLFCFPVFCCCTETPFGDHVGIFSRILFVLVSQFVGFWTSK